MRTSADIQERVRRIRVASRKVDIYELYAAQNGVCDLCGKSIQDSVLATLEHSTPVTVFAEGALPIDEAVRQATDKSNLRAAHYRCNKQKDARTREQWFAEGCDKKVGNHRVYTDAELLELQHKYGAPPLRPMYAVHSHWHSRRGVFNSACAKCIATKEN